MTARQYAKVNGIELVGKLTKMVAKSEKFNCRKGEYEIVSTIYYIDEAGTEITGDKAGGWVITTPDGAVI